jgi:hypothetical protein
MIMFYAFFCAFLLIVPGIISAEILTMLNRQERRITGAFVLNTLMFSFLILGANVLFKTLLGGGSQVFMLTAPQMITLSIVKYIALSLVFAVLLPHVVLMAGLLESLLIKKIHDKQ